MYFSKVQNSLSAIILNLTMTTLMSKTVQPIPFIIAFLSCNQSAIAEVYHAIKRGARNGVDNTVLVALDFL